MSQERFSLSVYVLRGRDNEMNRGGRATGGVQTGEALVISAAVSKDCLHVAGLIRESTTTYSERPGENVRRKGKIRSESTGWKGDGVKQEKLSPGEKDPSFHSRT